ncbi:MAG: hypothetical protein ACLSAH_18705 [Bilophila wadsworthia]
MSSENGAGSKYPTWETAASGRTQEVQRPACLPWKPIRGPNCNLLARTISLYHSATMKRAERGENEAEENLLNQVRQYGFASLEDAEQYFSTHE